MILGFKKTFPWGEPTNFKEKILAGVGYMQILSGSIGGNLTVKIDERPKIHTIRAGNRWKAGDLIHMAYGVRSKNYEQFNKGIDGLQRVVSVQTIRISCVVVPTKRGGDPETYWPKIEIDDLEKIKTKDRVVEFVKNDGFDSIPQFCKWFRKDFKGQIIHWTDYRYK